VSAWLSVAVYVKWLVTVSEWWSVVVSMDKKYNYCITLYTCM